MDKDEALQILWNNHGECQSCGWHSALYERYDEIVPFIFECEEKYYELPCESKNDEDAYTHRGIYLPMDELNKLLLGK